MTVRPPVFDALAADYDTTFTDTVLGRTYRAAVWRRLASTLTGTGTVLELNCGTGADTVWLARRGHRVHATDVSPAMVQRTRAAAARRGVGSHVTTEVLALEDLARVHRPPHGFDAALSDFGGLNCVRDPGAVLVALAAVLRPGARAVLVVMGRIVPWEWAWYLMHGDGRRAVRRLRRRPHWRGQPLCYPGVRAWCRMAGVGFRVERVAALGSLLPPPYAEPWAARHPRVVDRLDRCERRIETNPVVVRTADHLMLELVRR